MVSIRPEIPEDLEMISEIHREVFGSEAEPNLVAAIRTSRDFIPELSLIAELDGKVIGHILFSAITIEDGERTYPALSLAPMAVLPSYRGRGIGSAMVHHGFEICERLHHTVVVVIGHPEYYPRFGFRPAREYGLDCEFDVPDEAFMVRELKTGALKNIRGVVKYPPAFHMVV